MITEKPNKTAPGPAKADAPVGKDTETNDVIVCIDEMLEWRKAIPHAKALAAAFGGKVVLVGVIEKPENDGAPLDPVDWEIRKRAARSDLEVLAQECRSPDCPVTTQMLEGNPVERICAWCARKPKDIAVISGSGSRRQWATRNSLAGLIDLDVGTILMVPSMGGAETSSAEYRRIFVPLDGSAIAETAIPKAIALAKKHAAEIVISHIMPEAGITRFGTADDTAEELAKQIRRRNKRVGNSYLNRIRDRLKDSGLPVKTDFIEGGDVRRSLLEAAINKHGADLIVIASHGQTGQMDVATGHVTSFILDHSSIPVLMVRQKLGSDDTHVYSGILSAGVRPPSSAKS